MPVHGPDPEGDAGDAGRVRDAVMPGVPDDVVARALAAWTGLFGAVGFELFGQVNNAVEDRAAWLDHSMTCLGRFVGLPA
ncbi:MAG: TetR-like C-terminal domain-containing protein [Streptosporangiaceae bacterium]